MMTKPMVLLGNVSIAMGALGEWVAGAENEIERLKQENARLARLAGTALTQLHSAHEPTGCTDCRAAPDASGNIHHKPGCSAEYLREPSPGIYATEHPPTCAMVNVSGAACDCGASEPGAGSVSISALPTCPKHGTILTGIETGVIVCEKCTAERTT